MKDLNKAKHIKHPDLCNAVAASARIDEAIESMVPDQFEILLYKKNSEYSYINLGGMMILKTLLVVGFPPSHPPTEHASPDEWEGLEKSQIPLQGFKMPPICLQLQFNN